MFMFSFFPSPHRGRTACGKGRGKLFYRVNQDISYHIMFWHLGVPHNGTLKILLYITVPPAAFSNQHITDDKRNTLQTGLFCVPAKHQGVYPIHPAAICLTADHKVCLLLCIPSPFQKKKKRKLITKSITCKDILFTVSEFVVFTT